MWKYSNGKYSQYDKGSDTETLPVGVYTLEYGAFGSMYLQKMHDKFEFNYKIYGEDGFPERVIKSFKSRACNTGVMLSGRKGSGKTVQAKQICNESGLPVIVVTSDFNKGADLVDFLSTVDQQVVVFIDEFEKIFGDQAGLLTSMDGALNGKYPRLFVLTSNSLRINDAMLDRPGRILYLKRFDEMPVSVIREVIKDTLKHKELAEDVIEYLQSLQMLTIDIIKTVIAEVNLFGESPAKFSNFMNISVKETPTYDIFTSEGILLHNNVVLENPLKASYDLSGYLLDSTKYFNLDEITEYNHSTRVALTDRGCFTVVPSKGISIKL